MSRPLLPPRGVFVPTRLIYARDLPAAILQTWVQLRGLAWGDDETPPLSMKQLSEITGKSQSCLYGHMASLRLWDAVRWRPSGSGTFIISFDVEPALAGDMPPDSNFQDSRNLEKTDLFVSTDHSLRIEEQEEKGKFQDSGNAESRVVESRFPVPGKEKSRGAPAESPAAKSYHTQTGLRPNRIQNGLLTTQVTHLELWELTLEHWLSHGWSPTNVAGQLQLYRQGGPRACRFCQEEHHPPDPTLDVLDQLRKELTNG